ncbi:MAG: alpha/beta fold hydrolase [Bdellovibrionota bacterium]
MNPAAYCNDNNSRSVSIPLFYENSSGETFDYRYKFFPTVKPEATTVILLPGGPGGTLLNHLPSEPFSDTAIPAAHFNVIYIDPRGTGCNSPLVGNFPDDSLNSIQLAKDVLTIISSLNLKNYIIAGKSYGTVVATIAGNLITKSDLHPPKAIVLEGTFGMGWDSGYTEFFKTATQDWERVKSLLDKSISEKFNSEILPLGFNAETWGIFILNGLITGEYPGKGHILVSQLSPLIAGSSDDLEKLRERLTQIAAGDTSSLSQIFRVIGCRELFKSWGIPVIKNGSLVPSPKNFCDNEIYKGYNSRDWQLTAPIYYFQGPHDPATPLASAKYHFDNQTSAKRYFILTSGAAHNSLTASLKVLGCSQNIWYAIDRDPKVLQSAIDSCRWDIELNIQPPDRRPHDNRNHRGLGFHYHPAKNPTQL